MVSVFEMCKVDYVKIRCKVLNIFAILISILGMFYETYIGWTANIAGIGADTVTGIQGRYFIPIYIFIFISFMNKKLVKSKNRTGRVIDCVVDCFVLLGAIWTVIIIFLRYWN